MICYGPKSEKVYMQKRQENWLKYTNCADLKKITIRIYSNRLIYSSFISSPLNFVTVHFVWFKNIQLTVQVSCLFYFLLLSRFFKVKVNSGFSVGFYCFFKVGLKKMEGFSELFFFTTTLCTDEQVKHAYKWMKWATITE